MASSHDGREDDEEKELESKQKSLLEKKKALIERAKEDDNKLREIRDEEIATHERLQQIRAEKVEQMRRELASVKTENAKLRGRALEHDRKIESLEAELRCLKQMIADCKRERAGAGRVYVTKKELEIQPSSSSKKHYQQHHTGKGHELIFLICTLLIGAHAAPSRY